MKLQQLGANFVYFLTFHEIFPKLKILSLEFEFSSRHYWTKLVSLYQCARVEFDESKWKTSNFGVFVEFYIGKKCFVPLNSIWYRHSHIVFYTKNIRKTKTWEFCLKYSSDELLLQFVYMWFFKKSPLLQQFFLLSKIHKKCWREGVFRRENSKSTQ